MGKRNCLFCGAEGPLTKSHVIAQNLVNELPGTKEGSRFIEVRHNKLGLNPEVNVQESRKNPRVNKPRVLCAMCNNSWMNDYEKKVKDLVIDLALGNKIVLSTEDQRLLSIWATIAAAVRGALSFENALPIEDARYIRENDSLPGGYQVWLIQGEDRLDWPSRFLPASALGGEVVGWMAWLWVGKAVFTVASELTAMDLHWKLGSVAPTVKNIHPSRSSIDWPYFPESPLTWQKFHQVTDP